MPQTEGTGCQGSLQKGVFPEAAQKIVKSESIENGAEAKKKKGIYWAQRAAQLLYSGKNILGKKASKASSNRGMPEELRRKEREVIIKVWLEKQEG